MIVFLSTQTDDAMLCRYQALFLACFPASSKFTLETLKWLYKENPDGQVIGFDAFENGNLVAHYACIPAMVSIENMPVKALLSLNTATHPKNQGKGLFTKLAEMTYQQATEQGFHSIYGVANANSTPGFIRKLGFQLVAPLKAMIGIKQLGIDMTLAMNNAQFARIWSPASLSWRCANKNNIIQSLIQHDRVTFHAKALGNLLPVYAELPKNICHLTTEYSQPISPLRLYLGLYPTAAHKTSMYGNIPNRLRTSPLNMIFRSLVKPNDKLNPNNIFFSFLDFDAY